MGVRIQSGLLAAALLLVAPGAAAQPDFAKTFMQLDANKDGVLSFGELRYEGIEAARFSAPVGRYVTDDGFGVELWETPFGVAEVSMRDEDIAINERERAKIASRDVRVRFTPWLMIAANPELRTMTPERFERELRENAKKRIDSFDKDKDGGVSAAEIEELMSAIAAENLRNPDFQRGPGGDAMRSHKRQLNTAFYASLDLNDDGSFTIDEMQEAILGRMIAAFAVPAQ